MRYNMNSLRRLQAIEDEYREKLGLMYGCDGEDIPIEFDLSDLLEKNADERLEALVLLLVDEYALTYLEKDAFFGSSGSDCAR